MNQTELHAVRLMRTGMLARALDIHRNGAAAISTTARAGRPSWSPPGRALHCRSIATPPYPIADPKEAGLLANWPRRGREQPRQINARFGISVPPHLVEPSAPPAAPTETPTMTHPSPTLCRPPAK